MFRMRDLILLTLNRGEREVSMQKWKRPFWVATLVAGLFHGAVAWGQSAGAVAPVAVTKPAAATAVKPTGKVNLNTADETTLTALKGIGKVKAKAILDYRQSNGPSNRRGFGESEWNRRQFVAIYAISWG
jgi:hypothetical protein